MTKLKVLAEAGTHEIRMSRDFNAPRTLVFKTFTDPTLIPRWWGPKRLTTMVEQMEVKKGGLWRYIQHDTDGTEIAFNGVYHEVVAPERLVYTFEFEGMPGHIMLETITFEEHEGKTTMIDSIVCQTVEDRDAMVQSGMEGGAAESWERFEELLETL